ncbi:MAG TPA: hypothetical protein ENG82_05065 [Bacteroidetes bacterium]|nr:hypothetical protein [Bacteroidota bacterium]
MNYNPQKHHRRSIRLREYDYSRPGLYFVTNIAYDREMFFGKIVNNKMILNEYGNIVRNWWLEIPNKFKNVNLDIFVVMPNHFHGIVQIISGNSIVGAIHESPLQKSSQQNKTQRRNMLLSKMIGYFKMNSAKRINQKRNLQGISVWQRNYYEHIIRNENELWRIRKYIVENPVNWDNDQYFN